MSLVNQTKPIEFAEYVHCNKLHNEPAFKWLTRKILKKRERIISKIKACMRKTGRMIFSVKVILTVKEALALDRQNVNKLFHETIEKEMNNLRIDFEVLNKNESIPVGYT